ncbi:hypothetical protein BDV06DRAFT_169338 [Aspergillus oleicola]
MSGNYDYPPASRRTARASRPSDRPHQPNANRLVHLRNLLNTERNRGNFARGLEALDQELGELRSERERNRSSFDQTRASVDQQVRDSREGDSTEDHTHGARPGHEGLQRLFDLDPPLMNLDPSSSELWRPINRASRSRGSRGSDRVGRSRRNRDSILDQPVPDLDSSSALPLEPEHDHQMDNLRAKRRKLDSDDNREGFQTLRYGQYGQVVPGILKMELASCDGGTYEPVYETSGPENILLNDSSVYCTKSDRCNLILKHRGESPFCLKKLVIKAPKSGYDAPYVTPRALRLADALLTFFISRIQAGMVFVSMSADDMLERTARYQIQYFGSRSHRGRPRSGMQPSQEYMNSYRTPLQTLERASLASFNSPSDSETDTSEPTGTSSGHNTEPTADFHITTEYDERPEGTEHDRPGDNLDMPQALEPRRLERTGTIYSLEDDFLCSDSESSGSDEDDTSEFNSFSSRRRNLQRQVRAARRQYAMDQDELPRRRHVPPIPPSAPLAPRPGPTARPTGVGLMKPLAQFFIKRPKSSVSLKFDPPPSGRYILIKLWSPYNAGNIDIQSVVAHGYAGPRFFPAAGVR